MYCEQDFCEDQKKLLETLTEILPKEISFHILKFNTGDKFDCNCDYKLCHLEQEEICDNCSCCINCCECVNCIECGKKDIDYYVVEGECYCDKCLDKNYYITLLEEQYNLIDKKTNKIIIEDIDEKDIQFVFNTYYCRDFNDLLKCRDFDLNIVEYYDDDSYFREISY